MSATPMMNALRIGPAAPGLRAVLSHAAAVALPCPKPPPAAAMPSASAAAKATQSVALGAVAPEACANVAGARTSTVVRPVKNHITFFVIFFLTMNFRQEVVAGSPWERTGLTLTAFDAELVFFGDRSAEINDRENHKNKSLQECFENMEERKRQRNTHRNDGCNVTDGILGRQKDEQPHRKS